MALVCPENILEWYNDVQTNSLFLRHLLIIYLQSSAASNSLVILTRTKTDAQGRRHSVAVPLLQAPPSKAETGFLIEPRHRQEEAQQRSVLGGRRHSLQVGAGARHSAPGSGGRSPRRSGSIRRQSRRPSRQGFYQFLEQAVAFWITFLCYASKLSLPWTISSIFIQSWLRYGHKMFKIK